MGVLLSGGATRLRERCSDFPFGVSVEDTQRSWLKTGHIYVFCSQVFQSGCLCSPVSHRESRERNRSVVDMVPQPSWPQHRIERRVCLQGGQAHFKGTQSFVSNLLLSLSSVLYHSVKPVLTAPNSDLQFLKQIRFRFNSRESGVRLTAIQTFPLSEVPCLWLKYMVSQSTSKFLLWRLQWCALETKLGLKS